MLNLSKSTGLMLLVFVVCVCVTSAQNIDCRKYVFAPKCRGISAKRGLDPRNYPSETTFGSHIDEDPLSMDYLTMEERQPSSLVSLKEAERSEQTFSPLRSVAREDYRTTSPYLQNRILRALVRALVERNSGEWDVV